MTAVARGCATRSSRPGRGTHCRHCDFVVDVPGPPHRDGAVVTPAGPPRLMKEKRHPLTAEQWAAVTADLEPAVVIAGAGSGKTSIMAARVVYLVATGQVRPDQVLGLTFTTKAAGELGTRIRGALTRAGLERVAAASGTTHEVEETLEPVVATYNAYAAVAADRARSPDRARARHPGDGRRVALPARRPGHRAAPRPGHPAVRPPGHRRRLAAGARRRAERAPARPPPSCASSTRPAAARFVAGYAPSRPRATATRSPRRSSAAPSCSTWWTATASSRPPWG